MSDAAAACLLACERALLPASDLVALVMGDQAVGDMLGMVEGAAAGVGGRRELGDEEEARGESGNDVSAAAAAASAAEERRVSLCQPRVRSKALMLAAVARVSLRTSGEVLRATLPRLMAVAMGGVRGQGKGGSGKAREGACWEDQGVSVPSLKRHKGPVSQEDRREEGGRPVEVVAGPVTSQGEGEAGSEGESGEGSALSSENEGSGEGLPLSASVRMALEVIVELLRAARDVAWEEWEREREAEAGEEGRRGNATSGWSVDGRQGLESEWERGRWTLKEASSQLLRMFEMAALQQVRETSGVGEGDMVEGEREGEREGDGDESARERAAAPPVLSSIDPSPVAAMAVRGLEALVSFPPPLSPLSSSQTQALLSFFLHRLLLLAAVSSSSSPSYSPSSSALPRLPSTLTAAIPVGSRDVSGRGTQSGARAEAAAAEAASGDTAATVTAAATAPTRGSGCGPTTTTRSRSAVVDVTCAPLLRSVASCLAVDPPSTPMLSSLPPTQQAAAQCVPPAASSPSRSPSRSTPLNDTQQRQHSCYNAALQRLSLDPPSSRTTAPSPPSSSTHRLLQLQLSLSAASAMAAVLPAFLDACLPALCLIAHQAFTAAAQVGQGYAVVLPHPPPPLLPLPFVSRMFVQEMLVRYAFSPDECKPPVSAVTHFLTHSYVKQTVACVLLGSPQVCAVVHSIDLKKVASTLCPPQFYLP